jgi:hypothetical protein
MHQTYFHTNNDTILFLYLGLVPEQKVKVQTRGEDTSGHVDEDGGNRRRQTGTSGQERTPGHVPNRPIGEARTTTQQY